MYTASQWVHQHNVLLVLGVTLGFGMAVIVRFWSRAVRVWAVWVVAVALGVAGSVAVRTPATSITEYVSATEEAGPDSGLLARMAYEEPRLGTVDDIRTLLLHGEKPTLVEVYSDFGFS